MIPPGHFLRSLVFPLLVSLASPTLLAGPAAPEGLLTPTPDIKVNGSDGPVNILNPLTPVSITISLNPGSRLGQKSDLFGIGEMVIAGTSFYISAVYPDRLEVGQAPYLTLPLIPIPETEVYNGLLPPGHWFLHFGIDDNADGIVDWRWFDTVEVIIGPIQQ